MAKPPSVRDASRYPATAGVVLVAIVLSAVAWWKPSLAGAMAMDPRAFGSQPWRLVTSAMIHADLLHLAFNLGWIWSLGTFLEARWGAARTLAVVALFAVGPTVWEYALLAGGIGLSGVVYGLALMLYVLGRTDARFAGGVTRGSLQTLGGWFVLCVVLTVTGVWRVANIAHAVGALLGVLVGLVATRSHRALASGAIVALMASGATAATWLRPTVNRSDHGADVVEAIGLEQLARGEPQRAVATLEQSLRYRHPIARRFYNLGVAYASLGRSREAAAAFHCAVQRDPANVGAREALARFDLPAANDAAMQRFADCGRLP